MLAMKFDTLHSRQLPTAIVPIAALTA